MRSTRRGEQGLTTLSWLLIVAAVASIAALAVVLVVRTVEDTGDRIVDSEARLVAARLLAAKVEDDAKEASADDYPTWYDWERYFTGRCARIGITYSDASVVVTAGNFERATGGGPAFDATAAAAADAAGATSSKAQVQCVVQ